jgi:hypothetical protein
VTDLVFKFMKRRGTVVDFPYHAGLDDLEVCSAGVISNVSLILYLAEESKLQPVA